MYLYRPRLCITDCEPIKILNDIHLAHPVLLNHVQAKVAPPTFVSVGMAELTVDVVGLGGIALSEQDEIADEPLDDLPYMVVVERQVDLARVIIVTVEPEGRPLP